MGLPGSEETTALLLAGDFPVDGGALGLAALDSEGIEIVLSHREIPSFLSILSDLAVR